MSKENSGASYQQYFNKQHDLLRKAVRDFVKKEITPHVEEWEEAGNFPKELYKKVADLGFNGVRYPEDVGGTAGDIFDEIVISEELCRSGSMGLVASLGSHGISLPPIVAHGTPEQKEKYVKPVVSGDKVSALAITEPSGGSDVANLRTTAEKEGNYYIVNGSKTFITSALHADQITCAVRTGGPGAHGISFLIIDTDSPGYSVSKELKKMGWLASNTGELFFDNCKVPVENLIGEENMGFYYIMENFQFERLALCLMANMTSELALNECLKYGKEREAFGKPLTGFQVIRHKLVDMATLLEVSKEFTYRVAARMNAGVNQVKEVSMAKNFACDVSNRVTFDATQIFGGYGFMRGYLVERLYRDNRILSIGGGTQEIMKEIISKLIL